MKVNGPAGPSAPQGQSRAARPVSGFSIGPAQAAPTTQGPAATSGVSGVADVSALMALQSVEDATERRRRAVRRGGGLLDRLDELKLALLGGEAGEPALERLSRTLREDRPSDDDPRLKGLLDQIDLRAAVELAKADLRRNTA